MYYLIIFSPFLLFYLRLVLTNFIVPYYKKKTLYSQLQQDLDWPRIKKTNDFLTHQYRGVSGKFISKIYRYVHFIRNKEFIYGEIDFLSFYDLLKKTAPQEGDIFYDLGSGTGKAVFCAALFFNLSHAKGIELLVPLHEKAQFFLKNIQNSYNQNFNPKTIIEFINDNFLNYNFSDANIIYVAATCLNDETWKNLIAKMATLKTGTRIIIATKKIDHPNFHMMHQSIHLMSWGLCPVTIYKII